MRYWPTRVDAKCQRDPSLGVAHGCFWRYHPARAWAWELRLQDEIGPEFRIEEAPYLPGGRDLGDPGDGSTATTSCSTIPEDALAAIEKEATPAHGPRQGPPDRAEMRILETGLWSRHAEDLWALELRADREAGRGVPHSRARRAGGPRGVRGRAPRAGRRLASFLASVVPPAEMFGDEETDEEPLRTSARMRRTARDDGRSGPATA